MSHMRTRVMESRAYDHHYDPVFSMAGDRPRAGHVPAWSNSVATTNAQPAAQQRGGYRAAPRTNVQFRATQVATVPAIMPDGSVGRMPAAAAAAAAAASGTGAPAAVAPPPPPRVVGLNGVMSPAQVLGQMSAEVLGRSRVKFFKRPVVPFLAAHDVAGMMGADDQAAMHAEHAAAQAAAAAAAAPKVEESHRTLGTQSDYRESETQTDPYTPDYITAPEEPEPEILGLAHLSYGAGLPASMAELKLIQRMREKRAFEASLPAITDAASFEKRKAMLEARELAEWALREEEMREEQHARLEVLVDTLRAREAKVEELSEARVDLVRQEKVAQRDAAFDAIHRERIKLHRGLGKARVQLDAATAHMSGGYKELTSSHATSGGAGGVGGGRRTGLRDIVSEYADHASQVYAPVQRAGKLPVKNQVVDYGIPLITNFQGLSELERSLPASATRVHIGPPRLRPDGHVPVASLATRKGQAIRNDLEYVDGLLEAQRAEGGAVGIAGEARTNYGRRRPLVENVYKKFEPVQRAPTPTVEAPDEDEARRAVLLLQRLLRGRMVQNAMYEGKQHHRGLIAELRADESPAAEEADDEREPLHRALDTLQGELLSGAFDFASKEVVRAQQQNAVAALVKQAQLERRHREAEESGRRQAEQVLRLKRERQQREIMADHALTADRFLAEMLDLSVARYAAATAAQAAAVQAQVVQPLLAAAEADADADADAGADADAPDSHSSELVLGDLVASFLLPEVERRQAARKKELEERRFVKLAHEAVFDAVAGLQPGGRPGGNQQQEE